MLKFIWKYTVVNGSIVSKEYRYQCPSLVFNLMKTYNLLYQMPLG